MAERKAPTVPARQETAADCVRRLRPDLMPSIECCSEESCRYLDLAPEREEEDDRDDPESRRGR